MYTHFYIFVVDTFLHAKMSSPKCGHVSSKAGLELVGMLLLAVPLGYIYVFTGHHQPFHRGFYCDDKTIKHPYKEETITLGQALAIWFSLAIFFILFVETLRAVAEQGKRRAKLTAWKVKVPWIATELYRQFGYFGLGALGCLVFTEISKYSIGRLRPHYLSVCQPAMTDNLCKDQYGFNRYVTEDEKIICQGLSWGNATTKQLHEARLSFMSGHTSFSFYCAVFLTVYLQARLSNFPPSSQTWVHLSYRTIKVFRPFIQFFLLILSFWISLTRVSDYYHHPEDVLTGAMVGLAFAGLTLIVIADLFNKNFAFWKSFMGAQTDSLPTQQKTSTDAQESKDGSVTTRI